MFLKGKYSMPLKLGLIILMSLLFLIPLQMIKSLIVERETSRYIAVDEVVTLWGGRQSIIGPLLVVPYTSREKTEEGRYETIQRNAFFLPEQLRINGSVDTEVRSRGLYDVNLYSTVLDVQGSFLPPDFSRLHIKEENILWEEAAVMIEFPDMRGLTEEVSLRWDDAVLPLTVDRGATGTHPGALSSAPNPLFQGNANEITFSFQLHLRGGESLRFLPLGDATEVELSSDWTSPKFTGAYLPDTREIGDSGFEARWKVLSIGRNIPSEWKEGEYYLDPYSVSFGIDFITPVDAYMKSTRSIKYGILFIILPFFALFLFEIFQKKQVHPFQYLLVGLAECLFYLLLLSLSEHIHFNLAFLLGSLATTLLITLYSRAIFATWKHSSIIFSILSLCYLFLFIILQSEDYALLIGSLGIFSILAFFMIFTRRINWYRLNLDSNGGPVTPSD